MICGAMRPIHRLATEEERQRTHELVMRLALIELARCVQADHTYQMIITQEMVPYGGSRLYSSEYTSEYHVLIRIEDTTE